MPVTNNIRPKDDLGNFSSYEQKYGSMKTRLKVILYENELFQDELRKLQRELLDIYRDKETLLERVLQIEDIGSSSSDSESLSSDNECDPKLIEDELQAIVQSTINSSSSINNNSSNNNNKPQQKINSSKGAIAAKKTNQAKTVNNTGSSKPKATTGLPKKATSNSNSKPNSNGVAKTEKKSSVKVENKRASTKADSVTKPKTASRARNKSNANQNGNKVALITTTSSTSATQIITPTINSLPTMTPASMSQPTEMHQSQSQSQHQQHHPIQHQHHNSNQEQASIQFQFQQQQKITQHTIPTTHPDTSHPYQCIQQQVSTYPGYQIAAPPGHIQGQTHVQLVQLHPHSHQAGHRMMTADMISVAHPVHAQRHNIQQQQQQLQQQSSSQELHQLTHHQQHPHPHQLSHPHSNQHPNPQHSQQPPQSQQPPPQQSQLQQPQHQHALIAEQLSAEELEQYLEARRMEQAALLLPDWESSVPSEIFSADSGIKFMAED